MKTIPSQSMEQKYQTINPTNTRIWFTLLCIDAALSPHYTSIPKSRPWSAKKSFSSVSVFLPKLQITRSSVFFFLHSCLTVTISAAFKQHSVLTVSEKSVSFLSRISFSFIVVIIWGYGCEVYSLLVNSSFFICAYLV